MKTTFSTRILQAYIALVIGAGAAMAQQSTQITGRITDQSDAVVAGAEIAVTNTDTGIRRATTSNELGYYTVPLLQPGPYRMSCQEAGISYPEPHGNHLGSGTNGASRCCARNRHAR